MQQNAGVRAGHRRLTVDFLDQERRAVLEIDSLAHHYSVADQDYTLDRDHQLQMAGYRVLHVTPRQLGDADRFVRLVSEWLYALDSAR